MNAQEHYEAAERLLLSCQMPPVDIDGDAETYPAREDDVDSVGHALAAAQVHATLALAATQGAGQEQPHVVYNITAESLSKAAVEAFKKAERAAGVSS